MTDRKYRIEDLNKSFTHTNPPPETNPPGPRKKYDNGGPAFETTYKGMLYEHGMSWVDLAAILVFAKATGPHATNLRGNGTPQDSYNRRWVMVMKGGCRRGPVMRDAAGTAPRIPGVTDHESKFRRQVLLEVAVKLQSLGCPRCCAYEVVRVMLDKATP